MSEHFIGFREFGAAQPDRCSFIGGSDARIIMGTEEPALIRLWREKRREVEPEDLSGNLIVQLGLVTETLNRLWYDATPGKRLNAFNIASGIQCSGGWGQPSTAWSRAAERFSRPNSCCRGRFLRRRRPRNIWPSSSTICG
jgi:hypothetical protein